MKTIPAFLCALLLYGPVSAQDLPPDILADMYLLEATKALEDGDAQEAIRAFGKIEALDTEPPPEFAYFYGKLLVEHGTVLNDLLKGQKLLKSFVIRIAKDSEHYVPILELLSDVSQKLGRIEKQEAEARRAEAEFARKWPRGKKFSDCAECPEMVVVPAGSFMMGSPSSEVGRYNDEGPVHRVTMARPFAVGVYEVTFDEWDACVAGGGCKRHHRPRDRGWGRGRYPVISETWKAVQRYVEWLSRKTGEKYRLLSESEWEYVARGGTTGPFHTGATISTSQANYNGRYTYGSGRKGEYRRRTIPVGRFPANDFGLHDVHGNVWEWTMDCWNESYAGAPADGSAWARGGDCSQRVLRGGSWIDRPRNLRSANRSRKATGTQGSYYGFRVARTLTP